jgi:hypothetical protein
MSVESPLDDRPAAAEDDSPFLSMADFFSLISLTVIYIVIAFSPQSPFANESVDVVRGVASALGPASQIDNDIAYVSILSVAPNIVVRVMPAGNGDLTEFVATPDSQSIASAIAWTQEILASKLLPKRVIFYMGVADKSGRAHYLLYELLRTTEQKTETSLVLLDDEFQLP